MTNSVKQALMMVGHGSDFSFGFKASVQRFNECLFASATVHMFYLLFLAKLYTKR